MKIIFILLPMILLWSVGGIHVCHDTSWTDCGNGRCVADIFICDGDNDCGNMQDEENCDSRCTATTCSQKCRQSPKGPECYCNDGYILSPLDNKTCSDINECSEDGFCSHQCINLIGSYKCSCLSGYELINRTCQASGPEPILIYSTMKEISAIYLRSKRYFPIQKAFKKAAAVDADPLESKVYWVEIANNSSVYSININGTGFEVTLHNGLMIPEDLAVDYIARNLYFTDSGLKQILACKMDGSMCHVLHHIDLDKPRAISLDLSEGLLYWSDWGDNTSGIYRSGMDGSRRISFVSKNIKWPNGIAIDHSTNRLYWTDASLSRIEYITLDRKTRKVLIEDVVFHPYSLAVSEDNLYWSDWNTYSMDTCNKFTGPRINVMTRENGKHIMGIHVYHPVLARKARNPCLGNSCSHMCLIAPLNGYSCACPPGFTLGKDGRICLADDNFPMLLVNDNTRIYNIRPETVGSISVSELPITHIDNIEGLAYDWKRKSLYILDMEKPSIYSINMTNMVRRELVKHYMVMPVDIAFDWVSGNLYWVDFSKGTVEVVSAEGSKTAIIIVDLSKPAAIALVPTLGRMFVSTTGEEMAVTMYDMDGKNPVVLSAINGRVVALAVHPSASLLYFATLKEEIISSMDYVKPTSEPTIVQSKVGNVMSLAASDKYLYWTDSRNHVLNFIRQNTSFTNVISLPGIKNVLTSRKVVYSAFPVTSGLAGHNECQSEHGCSYLCLTSPRGRSCVCPTGMILSNDNRTCIDKPCTSDEFECVKEKKCVPLEFVCDDIEDCEDGSDEKCGDQVSKECTAEEYTCTNSFRCIPRIRLCDGNDDCGNSGDESEECLFSKHLNQTLTPNNSECKEFSCNTSGECIPWSKVCNGITDCRDLTDEGNLCSKSCTGDSGRCSQICKKTPLGSKCSCYEGYILYTDNTTCEDINECDMAESCGQFCNNTEGSFECFCADGYTLDHLRKCKAVGEPGILVYLLEDQIKGLSLSNRSAHVYFTSDLVHMQGIDYDASEGIFLFSDWNEATINSYDPNTNTQEVLHTTLVKPHFVRWDWVARNIYYTDDQGNVRVCDKSWKYCSTVIFHMTSEIRSFDISPSSSLMFWSVWYTDTTNSTGKIERAELDGSHQIEIITEGLLWPTGITVDHVMNMIYWIDFKFGLMEYANFDGLKRREPLLEKWMSSTLSSNSHKFCLQV